MSTYKLTFTVTIDGQDDRPPGSMLRASLGLVSGADVKVAAGASG